MTLQNNQSPPKPTRLHPRHGSIFRGKEIRFSEFLSFVLASAILIPLFSITMVIFSKEFEIRNLNEEIALLRKEELHLRLNLDYHQEQNRIFTLLSSIIGSKTPPSTIYHLTKLVISNSRQFGYDPLLLLAVISVESRFDPNALGRFRSGDLSGALGLMQVKYETALEVAALLGIENLKREDLFNPEINLVLGTAYLTRLISQFKSFKLGLLAYNQGPGTIRGNLSRKEPLSIRYYEKVLRDYYKLSENIEQE